MPNQEKNKEVFLSYARLDIEKARHLCDDLRKFSGLKVWFDKDDLLPGMRWRPAIRKAIRESDYFIALLSKQSSAKRGYRHSELRQAFDVFEEFPDDQIYLIPTRLDDCEPPLEELRDVTYADLFPEWSDGVERLGKAMRVKKPVAARRGLAKRRATAKKASKPTHHYSIGLVDLDAERIKLQSVVRGLNKVQHFFRFGPKHLATSRSTQRTEDGNPQLDLDRLSNRFYSQISPLEMDYVMGLTNRFLMFEEDGYSYSNYLSSPSVVDERVSFVSIRGLQQYADEARVSLDTALAYVIVSSVAGYFVDVEYHDEHRGCPWDFTEEHADIVKGLRRPKICSECSAKLKKNPQLSQSLKAMLQWGR